MRVNGQLTRVTDAPVISADDMVLIAKEVMQPRTWNHFEETNEADFAYSIQDLGRFRVNAYRQRSTIGMVFRLVRSHARSFAELCLPEAVRRLAEEQRGLILVTGPTGCGKTTTQAAMVDHINRTRECHIVTIEDPIEVLHHDELSAVSQREVGFDTASFLVALRGALRADPDVILVGEMRDTETVPTADGSGRVPALEIMIINGRIQQCIIEPGKGDITSIIREGEYYGMQTFDQALVSLLEQGTIDLRAATEAASNPHDLRVALQKRGLVGSATRS